MYQPYSAWADMLSKFHTSPEWVQALWLIVVPVSIIGVTWCVTHLVKQVAVAALRACDGRRGILVYGMYRDHKGRWIVYRHGYEPHEVDWTDPPPELIGRGEMVRDISRR